MPKRQPFTKICQTLANLPRPDRADLHLHTTWSDGSYEPPELVSLAVRSGLSAIAVTDHDTLGGIAPTREAASETSLRVISGVEISTLHRDNELHLLAYFFDESNAALNAFLKRIREGRVHRFLEMAQRLQQLGVAWKVERASTEWRIISRRAETPLTLNDKERCVGRRGLAEMLVDHGEVATVREAFTRYLSDKGPACLPKTLAPVSEAINLVHQAGGVTSWAHPSSRLELSNLRELQEQGLDAVEVEHPAISATRSRQLRAWAKELGLAVSGGSDSHGDGATRRAIGARSISLEDLDRLCSK